MAKKEDGIKVTTRETIADDIATMGKKTTFKADDAKVIVNGQEMVGAADGGTIEVNPPEKKKFVDPRAQVKVMGKPKFKLGDLVNYVNTLPFTHEKIAGHGTVASIEQVNSEFYYRLNSSTQRMNETQLRHRGI